MEFLGKMEVGLKNDREEMDWMEGDWENLPLPENRQIVYTLNKVRN